MDNSIKMYFHCRHCLGQGKRDKIAVGLVDDNHLGVTCDSCNLPVGTFELKTPIKMPTCELCAKGEPHEH